MKSLRMTKLALLAGMVLSAGAAHAGFLDATISVDKAINSRTLTVRYSGANAAIVELRIKGMAAATRLVNAEKASGETTFTIDTASLETGDSEIEIRLYDTDAKLVGTQKSVITIDRSGSGGPVFLEKPRMGSTVQGPVEIKLGMKQDIRSVYVSFFINDEQKFVTNVPPYSYLWDTEQYPNGWHEVQAWMVDSGNNTFKTEVMRVYVNNPGGRTNRPVANGNGVLTNNATSGTTGIKPKDTLKGANSGGQAVDLNGGAINPDTRVAKITPVRTAPTPLTNNDTQATRGNLTGTKPASLDEGLAVGHQTVRPVLSVRAPIEIEANVPAKTVRTAAPTPNPTGTVAINYGRRLKDTESFPIYLDGRVLEFDVNPRVTNGIAITPFRHLFEEAGGSVYWRHNSKEVQAHGLGSEVLFKVGSDVGLVNGKQTKFELAPFIEASRVLVPLSFMSDSLKLNVTYDAATGHVLVTTQGQK